jgi:hypothetical protein
MILNAVAGEYVQQINYSWDNNQIQYVQVISSTGNVLSRGNFNALLTSSSINYSADRPLLAFWGTRMTNGIGSVGSVTVDPVCIKGTTPVNGSQTLSDTSSSPSVSKMTQIIMGAVAGGILISIVIVGTGLGIYITRKRNFERLKLNRIQTIENENCLSEKKPIISLSPHIKPTIPEN